MNSLYLSNCLLCNAPLGDASEGHVNLYYCSRDIEHFSYNMTSGIIETKHDYGRFQFTLKDNEITCAIFYDETSGEKVWLTEEDASRSEGVIIKYPPTSSLPKIIEKFEIQRIFK